MKIIKYILCVMICFPVWSQEANPELITDRPDATEAPSTVPKGALQIETGSAYTSFEENNIQQEVFTYNTTLLRYGVLENLELRLGWNFDEGSNTLGGQRLDNVTSGMSPLLAGVKINIIKEKGWMPTIGFIGHLFLPITASKDYKPETTSVDFRFAFDHTLTDRSSIAYNLGAQWEADHSGAAYIYTFAYGYSVTKTLGFYAELYGDLPENNRANHFWDTGLTYLLLPNLQLDATLGASITKGQDLLVSAGFSYRIFK
ncbi:MAG: hypothetical protein ACJAYD_000478 [Patiriisocius sp.]|jgi:hypothetical protein